MMDTARGGCKVISVSNQKGGVGYEKLYIMQS